MGDIITITDGTRIINDGPGEPGDGTGGGSGGTGGGGGPRGGNDLDNKYACGDLIPGTGGPDVGPPPPDPGEDEPGPGDPYDPPDYEGEFDDFDDDDDPCRCYVYDFDIKEESTTVGSTIRFKKTFTLYQKCHDFSTGSPENPPETFLWIQDLQAALADGYRGNLDYGGLNSPCVCSGPCPTITIVLIRVVIDTPDGPGDSTPPSPFDPPTGTAGGSIFDDGGGGGGVNAGPFDPPTNTAGGSIFDDGGGGVDAGPDAAGGFGGFDFDGPDLPGNLGGGVVIPGDSTGPDAAGGLGSFDFEGSTSPDDIGAGVIIDGGSTGGGGLQGGNPLVFPDTIGGGVIIDSGPGGGDGGGSAPGTGTALNGEFLDDAPVNLNNFNNRLASDDVVGVIDPDIAIRSGQKFSQKFVTNTFGRTDMFGEKITEGLLYILRNNNRFSDWSANAIYSIEPMVLLKSLNPEILKVLNQIKHPTGKPLNPFEKASIFLDRIIEGDLDSLDLNYLRSLANKTKNSRYQQFIRSSSGKVNQLAALQLVDQYKYSLNQNDLPENSEARSTVQSYKVFARDVAKHLPIRVSGTDYKYYINDDDTFIDRTTLKIEDGDYFICRSEGKITRLPIVSEKDHAYIVDEDTRSRAIELLGGQNKRVFDVSASLDTNIEFNYSLSSPRQNAYIMKLVPSATTTSVPRGLLKRTRVSYELMEASSIQGRRDINNYIRYKSNFLTVNLDDSDLILDYIENGIRLNMEQTDIILDGAKTNKEVPILVRQIPWYLVIVPTNRKDKLLFKTKSKIRDITPERIVTRSLVTIPKVGGLDTKISKPQISRKNAALNGLPNAEGDEATQAVYYEYDPSTAFYQQTYESSSGTLIAASEHAPQRSKTSFRLIKEIISEFKTNYVIDTEGSEPGVNVFDVFSRLNLTEFNKFSTTENGRILLESIKDGLFEGIKVYPSIRDTGRQAANKTRLVQRRSTATTDQFPSIKSTRDGEYILPPTEIARSSARSLVPLDDLVAKCTTARGVPLA